MPITPSYTLHIINPKDQPDRLSRFFCQRLFNEESLVIQHMKAFDLTIFTIYLLPHLLPTPSSIGYLSPYHFYPNNNPLHRPTSSFPFPTKRNGIPANLSYAPALYPPNPSP